MRLDRYLSENTVYSRSEIKRLIKTGRVTVNAEKALNGATHINVTSDQIALDTQRIKQASPVYLMLNKPKGYVSATEDALHPTVIDLIRCRAGYHGTEESYDQIQTSTLQVVGRLDIDTTGLLLITDDGKWNHTICSPKTECAKTYLTTVNDHIEASLIATFAQGLTLNNEKKNTRPAQLNIVNDQTARLTIHEGKYHQVKRMFAAVGHHVSELHRESIGNLNLDESLLPGQYRSLTQNEVSLF